MSSLRRRNGGPARGSDTTKPGVSSTGQSLLKGNRDARNIQKLDLTFGPRLNLITGDNGLGKSFLLDLIWYAMTRQWPSEANPQLANSSVTRPSSPSQKAVLKAEIHGVQKSACVEVAFFVVYDRWILKQGDLASPGLVLYLTADGSFAVWDSERNRKSREKEAPPPAFVMTFKEVFNGLAGEGDARLCNGLIVDWAAWSDSRTYGFLAEQLSDGNQVSLVHREDIRTK